MSQAEVDTTQLLKGVLDLVYSGFFEPDHPEVFRPLVQSLLDHDNYMLLADFQSYADCQARVSEAFTDPEKWTRISRRRSARSASRRRGASSRRSS